MNEGTRPDATSLSMSMNPVAPLLQSRVLDVPAYPGLLASLDRFEILQILGSGGMGVVLLARDPGRGDPVAIKVLRPELVAEPRAVHRFLVEARHMQRLSHPHILAVLEVSARNEGPYFVIPYMAGGSLVKSIAPGKPMPADRVLQIAIGMAEALSFSHAKGLTHRDLKPGNVLLDGEGNAYLSDFGLVRTVYNDSIIDVRHEQTEGTPAYMPPEIARGEAGDTRCDIYSLGALMYEMLTGEPPYEGPGPQQILEQVKTSQPPPVLTRNPAAHPGLVKVAESAMAREIPDRYASMQQVLDDLERIAAGQTPIGSRRKLSIRARWPGIAAAILLGFGLIALAMFMFRDHPPLKPSAVIPLVLDRWQPGAKLFRHPEHPESSGAFDHSFNNGECRIQVTTRSPEGFSVRQAAWIDSKDELRSFGESEIATVLDKPGDRGVTTVQLCDGSDPAGPEDPKVVTLFRVMPTKSTLGPTTVQLRIYPSLLAAIVTEDGTWNDARYIDLSPLRTAGGWYLRLRSDVSSSGDEKEAMSELTARSVILRSNPAGTAPVLLGRVTHAISAAGIGGVSVRSLDSGQVTQTSTEGFYWLPLSLGKHTIEIRHREYGDPSLEQIELSGSQRQRLDRVLMQPSPALCGQVDAAIGFDRSLGGPGFLPGKQGILCVRNTSQGCELAELTNTGAALTPQWRDLALMTAEGNREPGRKTCASAGMARVGDRIYSVDTWTARLMILDPEKGVVESRIIEGLDWTNGLGIDGESFWTLDLNAGRGQFRLLCIDLATLKVLHALPCPSEVRGLAFGNDRLWVSLIGDGGTVLEIDPAMARTSTILRDAVVREFPGDYAALAFNDGALWGLSESTSRFCRIRVK